jgi:hypothetical protein
MPRIARSHHQIATWIALAVSTSLLLSPVETGAQPRSGTSAANNLVLEVSAPGLARVEVTVSGPGIPESLKYEVQAKDERAIAGLHAPPGRHRSIALTLFDDKGKVIGRGLDADRLIDAKTPTLMVPIVHQSGSSLATAVISRQRLVVTREERQTDSKRGYRFRAQLFDPDGRLLPIKQGMLRWDIYGPPGGTLTYDPTQIGIGYYFGSADALNPATKFCACLLGDTSCTCERPPSPPIGGAVTVGGGHSCRIAGSGQAYCWGSNEQGQLGRVAQSTCDVGWPPGTRTVPCDPTAVPVDGDHTFISISAGAQHTCAVDIDGKAWCWGNDANGQLGTAVTITTVAARYSPRPVQGTYKFVAISAGAQHTCALGKDKLIYCWGSGSCGQSGSGPESNVPKPVSNTSQFKSLSAGSRQNCAITTGGEVMCWGQDGIQLNGQCSGSPNPQLVPAASAIGNADFIASGDQMSCAATTASNAASGGSITCWGTGPIAPPAVEPGSQGYVQGTGKLTLSGYSAINHACVLEWLSGKASCWGDGFSPLGVPSTPTELNPPQWYTDIATGLGHTCAIDKKGIVWCWGRNNYGQLGDGTVKDSTARVAVVYSSPISSPIYQGSVVRTQRIH